MAEFNSNLYNVLISIFKGPTTQQKLHSYKIGFLILKKTTIYIDFMREENNLQSMSQLTHCSPSVYYQQTLYSCVPVPAKHRPLKQLAQCYTIPLARRPHSQLHSSFAPQTAAHLVSLSGGVRRYAETWGVVVGGTVVTDHLDELD